MVGACCRASAIDASCMWWDTCNVVEWLGIASFCIIVTHNYYDGRVGCHFGNHTLTGTSSKFNASQFPG